MKVLVFSDVHLGGESVQLSQFHRLLDFSVLRKLTTAVYQDKPDLIVNLGDLSEPWLDVNYKEIEANLFPELEQLRADFQVIDIRGNHDKHGLETYIADKITYTHGHLLAPDKNDFDGVDRFFVGKPYVYGHTHKVIDGWGFNPGSPTITNTFGIVEDGKQRIIRL